MRFTYKILFLITALSIIFYACSKDDDVKDPPFAVFTVDPEEGIVGTEFLFDASGSYNTNEDCSSLSYKWDFEGDGTWDTEYTTDPTEKHVYQKKGEYEPKLEIRDCHGWTNLYRKIVMVLDTASIN